MKDKGKMDEFCSHGHHGPMKYNCSSSGCVYGLGVAGTAIYYISIATSSGWEL